MKVLRPEAGSIVVVGSFMVEFYERDGRLFWFTTGMPCEYNLSFLHNRSGHPTVAIDAPKSVRIDLKRQ